MIARDILEWFIPSLKEAAKVKGDVEGHEFHGNQYGSGSGGGDSGGGDSGSGGSSGSGQPSSDKKLPKPKVMAGREVHDSFTNKKGSALYTLQKPTDGSDRGWAVVKTTRRDRDKSAIHFLQIQGKRDEVVREFNDLKKYEG